MAYRKSESISSSTPSHYFWSFLRNVRKHSPWCAGGVVALMWASSIFEGLALTMLFPLLGLIGLGGDGQIADIAGMASGAITKMGFATNIYTVGTIFVGLVAAQYFFFLAQSWASAGLQVQFVGLWRRQLTDALLRSEWGYFAQKKSGEFSHVLIVETSRASFLINYGAHILSLFATATMYLAVAWVAAWQVTLSLLASGLLIVLITQLMVRRPTAITTRHAEIFKNYSSDTLEFLSGMKLVRSMDAGNTARGRLWPLIQQLESIERKIHMHPPVLKAAFELTSAVALIATLVFCLEVLHRDGGTVLLIVALFVRLYPRISSIQQFVHSFRMHLPYYAIVSQTIEEACRAREVVVGEARLRVFTTPPEVALRNISVEYKRQAALRNISFTIPARKTVAIIGASGAGKSTLVDALLRLVPCSGGAIQIDGMPLEECDLSAWRRSIGYVSQETFLFNASIRSNIAFSNPDSSMEEIRVAADKACLSAFIDGLPDGYDTIVGERGVSLSGGQRQRIGIARALLGQKALLILDEATSALDSHTEAAIMADIERLHSDITIVIIAHRISTLRMADHIVVLANGSLVESGTWAELIERKGEFHRLWIMQSTGQTQVFSSSGEAGTS